MKIRLLCKLFSLFLLNVLLLSSLLTSCQHPGTEPPADPGPQAAIRLMYHIDPYVVTNKQFSIEVVIDLSDGILGEYDMMISYDTSLIAVNQTINDGVEPGRDGFISTIDVSTPGILSVSGTNETGIGPDENLQLLICRFTALTIGNTSLGLSVQQMTNTGGSSFEVTDAVDFIVTIVEPVSFPLTGQVLDSIGGAPVEEATVALAGTEFTTATDEDGLFNCEEIPIGVYDVIVTKPGRAGSKLEQVHVNGDELPVEIIQPYYNYLFDEITPPSITIKGVSRNEEYNGLIPIDISIASGSCPITATGSHKSIYLKIGMTSMSYYELAESSSDTLTYLWNTSLISSGDVTIKVVTYDTNNNRSELNLPVIVSTGDEESPAGKLPEVAPLEEYYYIVANTYGRSMEILREFSNLSEMVNQAVYSSKAPADSTILVKFSVEKYYNGIAVYKSLTIDGNYDLVCETSYVDDFYYKCIDYSPTLQTDTTVYYKLAYYNKYGIGPLTEAIPVLILPTYNLRLVSPANNSIVNETSATITWACEPLLDAQRTDWIIASNVLDATIVAYVFVINKLEYTLTDLLYNNIYEWDIRSYYEHVNSVGRSNVISRSFPRGKGSNDLSLNGAFIFTVVE